MTEDVESCASDEEINEEKKQPAPTQEEETQDEAKCFHLKKPQKRIEKDVEEVPPPAKRKRDDDENDTPKNKPHKHFERIASHSLQSLQTFQGSRSLQQSGQHNTRSGAVESYEYSPFDVYPTSFES
jgi:hypothetical protein